MEIIAIPNKILREKTEDVKVFDENLFKLVEEMFVAMEKAEGVGLAAPQIGKSLNLATIGYEPTEKKLKEDPDIVAIPKTALINPKITWQSKEVDVQKEGCLSIPKKEFSVPRAKKIHLEYFDTQGKKHKIKARGYLARVLQHETDHLKGKLIEDYQ